MIGKAIVRNAGGDCAIYNGQTATYKITNTCAHRDCTSAIRQTIKNLQSGLPVDCKKHAATIRGCDYGPGC